MLWVRGRFWIGEVLLILNLANLVMLYFRHSNYPRLIHIPIVSAPLAWTYVAILWDGAAAVNARGLAARIIANVFIWGILAVGAFYLLIFKDYTMGFELAMLSLGKILPTLAKEQILTFYSSCIRPNNDTHHRCPMGLCLCHSGPSYGRDACGRHTRSAWTREEYPADAEYRR